MSINWVMLPAHPTPSPPFPPLPHETTLYTSPPRTALSLTTPSTTLPPASQQKPFTLSSPTGTLHLTTKRLIYLPSTPTPSLSSFSAPLAACQDSHVSAPWIGPNVWTALLRPTPAGGLPDRCPALELRFTFKDGGAYDFQTGFERVRERAAQALEAARMRGDAAGRRGPGVPEGEIVMEELPVYQAGDAGPRAQEEEVRARGAETAGRAQVVAPDEPPPGYEEVQREVVEDEFARRLHEAERERAT